MKRSLALLLLTGCSTIGNMVRYPPVPGKPDSYSLTYGGTQRDVAMRENPFDCTGLSSLYALLDIPFSAALDTAVLPLALLIDLFCLPPREDVDRPFREYDEAGRPPR